MTDCYPLPRRVLIKSCFISFVVLLSTVPGIAQAASGSGIGSGKDGVKHPRIQSKPEPSWPKNIEPKVACVIVLRAVFRKEGKVTNIHLYAVRPERPAGLTEAEIESLTKKAVDAASQIKFKPATKDSRPVSMWMQLEYSFAGEHKGKPSESPAKENR